MSKVDSPVAENEGLEQLRQLHRRVDQTVQGAVAVYTALRLSRTPPPQRSDLVVVFEQIQAIASAVADLLDGLDRELGNDGSGVATARLSAEQVRGVLVEVEPPPQPAQQTFDPCHPRRSTAIGQLPSFYRYHVGLNNQFSRDRSARSFAWRQSVALWQTFTYHGGLYAADGLLSRLDRISDVHEIRRAPRTSEGGELVTIRPDGERVLTLGGRPAAQSYPWDRSDIAALRAMAERAGIFATATDEALLELQRREWCGAVDQLLQAAHGRDRDDNFAIAFLLDDAPAAHPDVLQRLERLAGLEHLDEKTRAKLHARRSGAPTPDELEAARETEAAPAFGAPSSIVRFNDAKRLINAGVLVVGSVASGPLAVAAAASVLSAAEDPRFIYQRFPIQHGRAGKVWLHLYALTAVAPPSTLAEVLPHISGIIVMESQLDDIVASTRAAAEELMRVKCTLPTAVLGSSEFYREWTRIIGAKPVYTAAVSAANFPPAIAMVGHAILQNPPSPPHPPHGSDPSGGSSSSSDSSLRVSRMPWWKFW